MKFKLCYLPYAYYAGEWPANVLVAITDKSGRPLALIDSIEEKTYRSSERDEFFSQNFDLLDYLKSLNDFDLEFIIDFEMLKTVQEHTLEFFDEEEAETKPLSLRELEELYREPFVIYEAEINLSEIKSNRVFFVSVWSEWSNGAAPLYRFKELISFGKPLSFSQKDLSYFTSDYFRVKSVEIEKELFLFLFAEEIKREKKKTKPHLSIF